MLDAPTSEQPAHLPAARGGARLFVWMHRCVAYGLLPTIVLVVSAEVFARYILRSPLRWSEDVVTSALLLTFIMTLPFCALYSIHVRVETMYEKLAPLGRRVADGIGAVCAIVFLGMLAFGAGREGLGMWRRDEVSEFAEIPQWPLAAMVTLVAASCCCYYVVRLFRPSWSGIDATPRS
jgi:TRAP-type C4-dicarboxylate transport system permease small subunit